MSPEAPRPAASIILCRNPADLEIYWVRRQDALSFLGGFHAFPGGRLSTRLDDPARYGLAGAAEAHAASGPDSDDLAANLAIRLCALRELYEETGVLLARPADPTEQGAHRPDHLDDSGNESFATVLRNRGLVPDTERLVPAGRWVTPAFSPARFDTLFYLAWAPNGALPVVQDGELAYGEWIRPEAALDEWSAGRALLAPPTLYALRGLEAAAMEASGNDEPVVLEDAAAHLTGAPESEGGAVTRIEMRPGFFLYPMKTRTLPPATHTNAFLVGAGNMVLIDPGSADPEESSRLLAFIDRLGTEGRGLAEIWLTHHHPDHVGAAARIAQALHVPVRAHPITAETLRDVFPLEVDGSLEDGLVRNLPGRPGWRLRVVHTPGHARGHIAVFEEVSRSLISGDMIAGTGFVMIDPPEGNMADYLESLKKLRELNAAVIFPSHGGPTGGATRRIEEYIEHRLQRESKVMAALDRGDARTIDEIIVEVYDDVEPVLHPLAARSLLAHLEKLVAEGRVIAAGGRYRRAGG